VINVENVAFLAVVGVLPIICGGIIAVAKRKLAGMHTGEPSGRKIVFRGTMK